MKNYDVCPYVAFIGDLDSDGNTEDEIQESLTEAEAVDEILNLPKKNVKYRKSLSLLIHMNVRSVQIR